MWLMGAQPQEILDALSPPGLRPIDKALKMGDEAKVVATSGFGTEFTQQSFLAVKSQAAGETRWKGKKTLVAHVERRAVKECALDGRCSHLEFILRIWPCKVCRFQVLVAVGTGGDTLLAKRRNDIPNVALPEALQNEANSDFLTLMPRLCRTPQNFLDHCLGDEARSGKPSGGERMTVT